MKKVITIIITIVVTLIILGISLYLLQAKKYEVISNSANTSGPNNKGYNVDNNVVKINIGPKPNSCYHLELKSVSIDKNKNVTIKIKDKVDKGMCSEWIVYPELTIRFKTDINNVKVYYENTKSFL